jgi:hypothetical protein
MQKVIITNARGQSVELGSKAPYRLESLEGTGGVKVIAQTTKSPFQDGESYINDTSDVRDLSFIVQIVAKTNEEMFTLRQSLLKVLSSKFAPFTVLYKYYGGEKLIKARVESPPKFLTGKTNSFTGFQRTTFQLLCPNPFWRDTFESSQEMADWIGGLQFGLMLPTMFSGRSSRTNKVITNSGDVPTPITFEFLGEAVNPAINNVVTGEYIKVNRTLQTNERLIITTEFGNKKVILSNTETGVEEDAFAQIDLGSTFFQLSPGENQLNYGADAGKENAKVLIRWKNYYSGV